jgi:uncharacterized lipoprotein YmbA
MRGPFRQMLLGIACLSFIACVHVGQQQEHPWRLFTLSPLPEARLAGFISSPGPVQPAIGVGPIHLPGYLDQDQIVTRISGNRFALSDNDRWAEPLADNLAHVLAHNLSMLLKNNHVTVHPWTGQQKPIYQIEVDVLRFEMDTTRTVHLVARYVIRDVGSRQMIAEKEVSLTAFAPGSSTEQAIASLSEALGNFSVEIAKVIRECVQHNTTQSGADPLETPTFPNTSHTT